MKAEARRTKLDTKELPASVDGVVGALVVGAGVVGAGVVGDSVTGSAVVSCCKVPCKITAS